MKNSKKGHDEEAHKNNHAPPESKEQAHSGHARQGHHAPESEAALPGHASTGASEKQPLEAPPAASASETPAAPVPPPRSGEEEWKDRWMRLQADFDNFRKRNVRDKADYIRRANEELIQELLPVLDHLERALGQAQEYHVAEAFVRGLCLIRDQLQGVLQKAGIRPMDSGVGQPFDPQRYEAVSQVVSAAHAEGTIVVQTRRGYLMNDVLLRPAQVVVTTRPVESGAEPVKEKP